MKTAVFAGVVEQSVFFLFAQRRLARYLIEPYRSDETKEANESSVD